MTTRSTTAALAVAGAFMFGSAGCSDDGEAIELVVETYNVGLAGAFIPHEDARRQPLADAIAAMDSDIVCLQEVWRQSDKDLILHEAAAGSFPYTASFQHDLNTPIDDATDQNGDVPPPYTTPPCGTTDLQTAVNTALDCLIANCSTEPGSEDGYTTSTACAQEHCVTEVATLILGDYDSLRCYGCVATGLPTESFADIRELCTTEVNAGLAFRGQSGVAILSRYPITASDDIVLPGTWNRRVIATATVELPDASTIDVYCNHLTPIFDGLTYPYTGQYGNGITTADGWAAEQLLQAGKLIAHVEEGTGDGRALILGDFNAGRADDAAGLVGEGVATMDLLEGAFTPAVPADATPGCTYCPDNTLNDDTTDPAWIDHIFMRNIDASAVGSMERTFADPVVAVDDDPSMVHLSDHYGLRSTLSLP